MTQEWFAEAYMSYFIEKFWAEHPDVNPTPEIRSDFELMRFAIESFDFEDRN